MSTDTPHRAPAEAEIAEVWAAVDAAQGLPADVVVVVDALAAPLLEETAVPGSHPSAEKAPLRSRAADYIGEKVLTHRVHNLEKRADRADSKSRRNRREALVLEDKAAHGMMKAGELYDRFEELRNRRGIVPAVHAAVLEVLADRVEPKALLRQTLAENARKAAGAYAESANDLTLQKQYLRASAGHIIKHA